MATPTKATQKETSNDFTRLHDSANSGPTSPIPEAYRGDVIAQVWLRETGRYHFLAGRIQSIETNHAGQKVAVVRFFAPIKARVQRILWNNIYVRDAVIEIKYGGELYIAVINHIDFDIMEVFDEIGETVWLPIHTIKQVLSHQDLAEDFVMRQIALAEVS